MKNEAVSLQGRAARTCLRSFRPFCYPPPMLEPDNPAAQSSIPSLVIWKELVADCDWDARRRTLRQENTQGKWIMIGILGNDTTQAVKGKMNEALNRDYRAEFSVCRRRAGEESYYPGNSTDGSESVRIPFIFPNSFWMNSAAHSRHYARSC